MVYFGDGLVIRTLNISKSVPKTAATNDKLKSNNMAQPAASHTLVLSTLSLILIRITTGLQSVLGESVIIWCREKYCYMSYWRFSLYSISASLEKYWSERELSVLTLYLICHILNRCWSTSLRRETLKKNTHCGREFKPTANTTLHEEVYIWSLSVRPVILRPIILGTESCTLSYINL